MLRGKQDEKKRGGGTATVKAPARGAIMRGCAASSRGILTQEVRRPVSGTGRRAAAGAGHVFISRAWMSTPPMSPIMVFSLVLLISLTVKLNLSDRAWILSVNPWMLRDQITPSAK